MSDAQFTLYTVGTPNGIKASIALEELGLKYNVYAIDFSKNEQKEPWFLKINPNGRIPALVDHSRNDFAVFESGAILIYLAELYDPEHKLLSTDINERSLAIQWLMFQMGGVGPMQGQANHFIHYTPEKIPYGITRYTTETKRLYSVLETQLSDGKSYITGPNYSIADISLVGWVWGGPTAGIDFAQFPKLKEWLDRVLARPAVDRGVDVPTRNRLKNGVQTSKNELENVKQWIQKAMKEDAEKLNIK